MNKPKVILLGSCATFIIVSFLVFDTLGKTGAYFSDHKELNGSASLKLSHQTIIKEEIEEDNKHIVIANIGETEVVVRVRVFGGDYISVEAGEDWQENEGWYYYGKALKKGEETTEIIAVVDKQKAPEYDFDVIVINESERSLYDGDKLIAPKDDWKIEYAGGENE